MSGFSTVAEAIARRPEFGNEDFAFFSNENSPLTSHDHYAGARRVALKLMGVYPRPWRKGTRVLVVAPIGPDLLVSLAGCWLAGAMAAPVDSSLTESSLQDVLRQFRPDIMLIDRRIDSDGLRTAIAKSAGCIAVEDISSQTCWPDGAVSISVDPQDPALVIFTSGSTGMPKGVMLSQANLVIGASNVTSAKRLTPDDRALCVLPLSHLNGLMTTYVTPLLSGGSVVYLQGLFSAELALGLIDSNRCTWFSAVPTQYAAMMKPPVPQSQWSLSSLRFCRSASSSLLPSLRREFESYYGVPVIETMGMTETSAQVFSNPLPPKLRKDGSIGLPVGFEVRVMGADGETCADEVDGEIEIRGPGIMLGYLDSPDETVKAFDGEWLKSGDLGHRDSDGYYYITGRKKEIVIFAGLNISLRYLEHAILDSKLVADISCVGETDDYFGERVVAYIQSDTPSDEYPILGTKLTALLEGHLPNRQALKDIRFVAKLPRTNVGKIIKSKLVSFDVLYRTRRELPREPVALLATLLSLNEEQIQSNASLGSIPEWDSLAHMGLVMAVENILERNLGPQEIQALTSLRGLGAVLGGNTISDPFHEDVAVSNGDAIGNPDLLALMVWNRLLPSQDGHSQVQTDRAHSLITRATIVDALREAGLTAGDLVMVHSDVAALGPTEAGANRQAVLELYLSAFQMVLTETGTLFVCTSFEDYGRYGTPFVREKSPSRLGAFSEFVRTREGSLRSMHPIVSVTGLGPHAEAICDGAHFDGFGYDSPWGRLHRANAKMMTIGMAHYPEMGLTFLHYIEHLYGVPYQYTKLYTAPVFSDGKSVTGPFTLSVRYLDFSITYDTNPFRDHLCSTGRAKLIPLGNSAVLLTDCQTIVAAGIDQLRQDRYCFLKTPPTFRPGVIPMDGATGELCYVYDKANGNAL